MIQKFSRMLVADNSGAKEVMCIGILDKGTGIKFAYVGDRIKVTVKFGDPNGLVKKSQVHTGVVVRTKKEIRRSDGSYIRFGENAVVILNKDNEPMGTRIFGPIPSELKDKGYTKIISLAPEVV